MRKVYSILISGLMTEKEARTIANVAGAVVLTAEVEVIEGEYKVSPTKGTPGLKPRVLEVAHY